MIVILKIYDTIARNKICLQNKYYDLQEFKNKTDCANDAHCNNLKKDWRLAFC